MLIFTYKLTRSIIGWYRNRKIGAKAVLIFCGSKTPVADLFKISLSFCESVSKEKESALCARVQLRKYKL